MRTFPMSRALTFMRMSNEVNLVHAADVEKLVRVPDPDHPGRYLDVWVTLEDNVPCRLNPASSAAFVPLVAEQRGVTQFEWVVAFAWDIDVVTDGLRLMIRGRDDPLDEDTAWQRLVDVNHVIWPRGLLIERLALCVDTVLE